MNGAFFFFFFSGPFFFKTKTYACCRGIHPILHANVSTVCYHCPFPITIKVTSLKIQTLGEKSVDRPETSKGVLPVILNLAYTPTL